MSVPDNGRPRLVGRVGSLDAFWPLIEPLLVALQPRRLCEIGVDQGTFTRRLLAWTTIHGGAYVGIDPALDPSVVALVRSPDSLVSGRSVDVLPGLEPCDVYFIDGDHNYHTVRRELDLIACSAHAAGQLLFVHDVGWPWARRDMYHDPHAIPAAERQAFDDELGVSLESDALIPGGLCSPGRYAIAHQPGGARNGVLTAVEDFLRDGAKDGWQIIVIPVAYGLAVIYQPERLPASCLAVLDGLATARETFGAFLESCEANFLSLYLYAEAAKAQLAYWTDEGQPGQTAYNQLQTAYEELAASRQGLDRAYQELSTHSENLLQDYHRLLDAYHSLERSVRGRPATG